MTRFVHADPEPADPEPAGIDSAKHGAVYVAIEAGGTKWVCALADAAASRATASPPATRPPPWPKRWTGCWRQAPRTRASASNRQGWASPASARWNWTRPRHGRLLRTPKAGWSDADLLGELQLAQQAAR